MVIRPVETVSRRVGTPIDVGSLILDLSLLEEAIGSKNSERPHVEAAEKLVVRPSWRTIPLIPWRLSAAPFCQQVQVGASDRALDQPGHTCHGTRGDTTCCCLLLSKLRLLW